MSSSRTRISPLRNPTLPGQTTPEQRYWRGYTNPQLVKENHPISQINFNPSTYDFAVVSSTRIQVFSAKTRQVTRTFSRFRDTVYSGEFRQDGKLLVASDASGLVSIYDANQARNILVSITPSSHATHVAKFNPSSGHQLVTGSDDRVVRVWDIAQARSPLVSLEGHRDYVRSACFVPGSPSMVVSGCYDGVVRLFDTRSSTPLVAQFEQESPVEDVLAISPTTLVSAGGPRVKIWDIARGAQLHELGNFTKATTCLHDTGDRGLLVGSLDGHVKIFDSGSASWDVKFGWKFGSGGVLSCAVSPAENGHKHFVAGLTSGLLSIRTRKAEPVVKVKQERSKAYSRMMRGKDYTGSEEHHIVNNTSHHSKKLRPFERHLNAFRWADALDAAFVPGMQKETTLTVLGELKKRGKVRVALYGRDEVSLLPLVQWFTKMLDDPRSVGVCCDYLGVILEMYGELMEKSVDLGEAFGGLMRRIELEVGKCRESGEIGGMLEMLTA